MQNITCDPLASSRVEKTISMQPQMVVGGYKNTLGTHNSCLGSTYGGNPLPWNVNIPGGSNASWNTNANWNYPSQMGGNAPKGHPLIYPSTIPRGSPPINPIPQWIGQVSERSQSFWIQPL